MGGLGQVPALPNGRVTKGLLFSARCLWTCCLRIQYGGRVVIQGPGNYYGTLAWSFRHTPKIIVISYCRETPLRNKYIESTVNHVLHHIVKNVTQIQCPHNVWCVLCPLCWTPFGRLPNSVFSVSSGISFSIFGSVESSTDLVSFRSVRFFFTPPCLLNLRYCL
jgi:hypothetical protein